MFVPDGLSIDDFVRKLPCPDERENFRDALHRDGGYFELYTSLLDDDPNDGIAAPWRLVWARSMMCNAVFLFDARGALRDQFAFHSRGTLTLGDIVQLEKEPNLPELRFEEVAGSSICCYPIVLHFYRVTPRGRFQKLLQHERSYNHVERGVLRDYWYRFSFEAERVVVDRVFPASEGRPAEEYTFVPALGRYEPTAATRKMLRDEAAAAKAKTEAP